MVIKNEHADAKRSWSPSFLVISGLALGLFCWVPTSLAQGDIQPENTVEIAAKESVSATREMVVAAHPLAVEAGMEILTRGGTAVDAMVAVQMVLNLVEPQSSGVGGGAFLLYHDAKSQSLIALDGREFAPQGVSETMFLGDDGKPRRWFDMVPGGLSVGVPGTLALMDHAHARFGQLPWNTLFDRAIELSANGFEVSPRLSKSLEGYGGKRLQRFPAASDYFFPNGQPLQSGELLKNPQFADTLRTIQRDRGESFYRGQIAREIVDAVQGSPINPGVLELADLAAYRTIERNPVCSHYREHRVCGMGPPSSGGVTVAQILGILEFFNLKKIEGALKNFCYNKFNPEKDYSFKNLFLDHKNSHKYGITSNIPYELNSLIKFVFPKFEYPVNKSRQRKWAKFVAKYQKLPSLEKSVIVANKRCHFDLYCKELKEEVNKIIDKILV